MLNWYIINTRALILVLLGGLVGATATSALAGDQAPVVVELFTSQGCSSCPPADEYLGELSRRSDVLALSYHVDYWNYIGWTDPFGSKAASQRQRDYAKHLNLRYVYTPQMVINGAAEGIGSERETIEALIKTAERDAPARQPISVTRNTDGRLAVHVDAGAASEPATVMLIGFDREHVTSVLRGENEGRTLREYQVVRSCEPLGTWRGEALDFALAPDQAGGDGGVAVLLQTSTGRIIGAALLKPPTS